MMIKTLILGGILLILYTSHAQKFSSAPSQEKPQVPGTLGKYFIYVNCTDCKVDGDLIVEKSEEEKSGKNSETTKTTETHDSDEYQDSDKEPGEGYSSKTVCTDEYENSHESDSRGGSSPKTVTPEFNKSRQSHLEKKPQVPGTFGKYFFYVNCTQCKVDSDLEVVGAGDKSETNKKRTRMPMREDDDQKGKKKGNVHSNKSPSDTEESANPYLPKDKKDSDESSFTKSPPKWVTPVFTRRRFKTTTPVSTRPPFKTITPMFTRSHSNTDEPVYPSEKPEYGEYSEDTYSFPEPSSEKDYIEHFINSLLSKDSIEWLLQYIFPHKAENKNTEQAEYNQDSDGDIQKDYSFTESRFETASPESTRSPSGEASHADYANPLFHEDALDLGDYYFDDDENLDLQHFKKLIMSKYENPVFRYADLQGEPDETGLSKNSVFCVYETVKEGRKTLDYSFQKPCKIVNSPGKKVNMTALHCRQYSKSKVCLMKVECPKPPPLKPKNNECVEQIIIRKETM